MRRVSTPHQQNGEGFLYLRGDLTYMVVAMGDAFRFEDSDRGQVGTGSLAGRCCF